MGRGLARVGGGLSDPRAVDGWSLACLMCFD